LQGVDVDGARLLGLRPSISFQLPSGRSEQIHEEGHGGFLSAMTVA
jgi:hypothetical protein